MNEKLYMAEILPPPEAAGTSGWLVLFVHISAIAIVALGIYWHRYNQPLRKLERNVRNDHVSPRQCLHELAKLRYIGPKLRSELDTHRFASSEPNKSSCYAYIKRCKPHG